MKKLILLLLINFIFLQLDGQEKIWLDASLNITNNKKDASYYQIANKTDSLVYSINYFRLNNILLMNGSALDAEGIKLNGWSQWYHENGLIESEGFYENGAKIGIWKRYHSNGESKPDKMYSNVNMNNIIFNSARVMPKPAEQIPDLNTYFKEKLIYDQAFDIIELSPIKTQFIVFRNGSIGEVKIDKRLTQNQHQLMKQIIEYMPDWIPGSNGTQTINVRIELNIELQN